MEVEHVPYIFGSFTRRRQSQHMGTPTTTTSNTPASPQSNSPQNSTITSSIRLRPAYQHAKSKSQPEETTYHPVKPTNLPTSNGRTLKTRSCLVQQPVTTPRRSGIIPGVIGLNGVSQQKSAPIHSFNVNSTPSAANSSVTDCFSGVSFSANVSASSAGGARNTVNYSKDIQYEKNGKVVNGTKVQSEHGLSNGKLNASCLLCGKIYLEPRVLSCLHTFCTRCLQELVEARRNEEEMWLPVGVHSNTSGSEASLLSSTSGSTTPTNNDKDSLEGSTTDSNSLPRSKATNRHSNTSISSNNNRIIHNRSNSSPVSTTSTQNGISSINSNNTSKFSNSNRDSNLSNTSDSGGCIICPVCSCRTALSRHGVYGLSPDYVVQHRLVLSTLNDENTRLLCDLCTGDVTASHRCSDCLINLCPMCTELHHRHNNHNHELLTIKEVRQRGLMRIHRRIMCLVHPEVELTSYCSQCTQVVCSDCVRLYHNDHNCESASRAAVARAGRVQRALQKAQSLARREQIYADQLKAAKIKIEDRCHMVEDQIEKWIEEYRRAIEEHRKELLDQVNRIREDQLSSIISQQHQLECRLQDAETSINFTETLLNEGSDIELLTFIATILKRLEKYDCIASSEISSLKQNKQLLHILRESVMRKEKNNKLDDEENEKNQIDGNNDVVKFLPQEKIIYPEYFRVPLYGVVTDQYVCPKMSEIRCDGLELAKINNVCDFLIICRDEDGNQLKYGGEKLFIQIKHTNNLLPTIKEAENINKETLLNEDSSFKMNKAHNVLPIQVEDKHDGTYSVKFIPKDAGTFLVNVLVRGRHIQDSPLTLHLQNTPSSTCKIIRPHRGVYHCCTWCSSGGKKITDTLNDLNDDKNLLFNGNCGCGGTMPGGYQGCGHGHVGHPGNKHWSCCGNTQEIGSNCTFTFTKNRGRTQNKVVADKNSCNYNKDGANCSMKNNERLVKGQTTKVYHITL